MEHDWTQVLWQEQEWQNSHEEVEEGAGHNYITMHKKNSNYRVYKGVE